MDVVVNNSVITSKNAILADTSIIKGQTSKSATVSSVFSNTTTTHNIVLSVSGQGCVNWIKISMTGSSNPAYAELTIDGVVIGTYMCGVSGSTYAIADTSVTSPSLCNIAFKTGFSVKLWVGGASTTGTCQVGYEI